MKTLITCLTLLIATVTFSQSPSTTGLVVKETTKVENVAVTVTVDSLEEIESSFKIKDIKEILSASDDNETISFKIICNGETMKSGVKSNVSYKIEGNSSKSEEFLNGVEVIRKAAIKYYKNKA